MSRERAVGSLTLVLFCIVACSQSKNDDKPIYVLTSGIGISNVVALGMTRAQVVRANKDFTLTSGSRERERDRKSPSYVARVPALDAYLTFKKGLFRKRDRLISIDFYISPTGGFTGSLSCGLSFAEHREIRREDVVRVFGEPLEQLTLGSTNYTARTQSYIDSPISHSVLCPMKDGSKKELLYYPTNGILFDLREDSVTRISVHRKAAISSQSGRE
jgi:hypothetical protein